MSDSVLSRIDRQLEELLKRLTAIESKLDSIENNLDWQKTKDTLSSPKKDW